MSVSITNTVMAKYRPMTAGLAEVIIQITVTTSGTASTQIFIDVPFAVLDTNAYPGLAAAQDGTASTEVALGVFNGNLGKIQWRHAAASVNWGIGAGIILQIHGFYPY